MPWTFAFILKTWSDNDDCKFWNALSSRDCGIDEDTGRNGGARPASISWKLMLLVVAPLLRVSLSWWGCGVRQRNGIASERNSDIMWLKTFSTDDSEIACIVVRFYGNLSLLYANTRQFYWPRSVVVLAGWRYEPWTIVTSEVVPEAQEHFVDQIIDSKLVSQGFQELSGITLGLIRCLTIHGCFRTSVRGKRFCGSYRSNYRRVMSVSRPANHLYSIKAYSGDQIFHFFWQTDLLVVKFQVDLRNSAVCVWVVWFQ